jgi:PAS domain S-box-containing protein
VARPHVLRRLVGQRDRGNGSKVPGSGGPSRLRGAGEFASPEEAAGFAADVLQASTRYSIIGLDVKGGIVLWNEGARRIYGYEARQVLRRPEAVLHAGDGTDLSSAMMEEALRSGAWEGTVERARKNGDKFTARVVITPRRDRDNALKGYLLISSDVTAETRLRAQLEEAEGYRRQLLEFAPDAIIGIDPEGRIQLTNSQVEHLFGYSSSELIGKPIETLVPERYHAAHTGHRAGYFDNPRTRPMGEGLDLWARRKDGSEFPCEISLSATDSPDGQIAVAAVRDVTARERAEGQFRNLLESAPDAMVIVDDSGTIQLANAETERLFGYPREELIGEVVEMLIPERYHARHPGHRAAFFRQPHPRPMGAGLELSGVRRDGTEFPVEISLSPLETDEGMLATAAIRDVTERKQAETELQGAYAELERASLAKDRFLASMSHELRTPLNAILGFTGTLLMELPGELNEDQRAQLKTVQTNGKHLLSIINDLLDVAKIESGKVEITLEEIDCNEVVEEVLDGLRPLANEKDLELGLVMPEAMTICSDRRALSQILINLINNAIKFTDEGSVRLEVKPAEDGDPTCFRVIDSGMGIRQEDQRRLFEAFEQSEVAAESRGTGLGLYICRQLAPMIGGQVQFESEHGVGSTFTLEIEPPARVE